LLASTPHKWADTRSDKRQKRMSNDPESGEHVVKCECGFEARGKKAELIPKVQQHGRDAHNMEATREQVLAMARAPDY
jgi:predicted small metal-binding protein